MLLGVFIERGQPLSELPQRSLGQTKVNRDLYQVLIWSKY